MDSNNEKGLFLWREAHLAMNDVDSAQADFQKSCSSTPAAKPPWPSWLSAISGSTSSSLQEKQLCNRPKVKLQHPSSRTPYLHLQVPENYFYVPDLGQVPEIDVPCYLPDLPGIADDLRYTEDLSPGTAPLDPDTTIPELLASP